AEREVEFRTVKRVEQYDLVLLIAEVLQACEDVRNVVEQITEDEYDSAPSGAPCKFIDASRDSAHSRKGAIHHRAARFAKLIHLPACAEVGSNAVRDQTQPHTVGLRKDEVSHRRSGSAGEVVLRTPPGCVIHRLARVDDEPRDEVGFLFVLLEEVSLGAPVDF